MRDVPQRDVARIGLLLCDHAPESLRHIAGDYDAMFAALLAQAVPDAQLRVFDVTRGVYPEAISDVDGYLISGSSASVYDNAPWIADLEAFVRKLHQAKTPTVGVCFGHQLVARALGGEVALSERGWGIGVRSVPLSGQHWWMRPTHDSVSLVVSHQDQVLSLPAGVASDVYGYDHCPISFYTIEDHFLCMQGHPEYPPAYGRALADRRSDLIPQAVRDEAAPTFEQATDADVLARWIINFLTREGR